MNLRPLNDNVILKEDPEETVTSGGIHLPQLRRRDSFKLGTVVAVGPGKLLPTFERSTMFTNPGDRVRYNQQSGTVITYGEDTYLVLSERNVLAIDAPDAE